jgi:hypothetical protein
LIADAGPSSLRTPMGVEQIEFLDISYGGSGEISDPGVFAPRTCFPTRCDIRRLCERVLGVGPIDEIWYFAYADIPTRAKSFP